MTKRRTYTKEFKIEAVEPADEIDNSAQAERDLGIPHGQIYKCRKKLKEEGEPKKAFPGKGYAGDAKMKALKRRLDRLEEENAILKKAIPVYSTAPVERRPH